MAIRRYEVKRRHFGDRDYSEGDIREADENDVLHLVDTGVLAEAAPEAPAPAAAKTDSRKGR